MTDALPQRLRELRDLLADGTDPAGAGDGTGLRARCEDRLDRDLLPRTAGSTSQLVVGIVGPNNAGKSALFNALVGRPLSPSAPTGGATRRLVGAVHPRTAERWVGEPTLARFPVERVKPGGAGITRALESTEEARQLLFAEIDDLPEDVLLIDTPDFDSILRANRLASEALLQVADLAVVVVTRHTYQNADVVSFLQDWLAHERPWVLVYNESFGEEITREHAQKLAEDLASPPLALFHAPHDLSVQAGDAPLDPKAIEGAPAETSLREWLLHLGKVPELKARALASSLRQLRADLVELAGQAEGEGRLANEVLSLAGMRALAVGERVAGEAMPMGPFLEAFREVLDRRPTGLQRGLRTALRRGRLVVEGAIARLPFGKPKLPGKEPQGMKLAEVERLALIPHWAPFFEVLARELGPSGSFWKADPEGRPFDDRLREALTADLAPDAASASRERAIAELGADAEVLRAFESACEELIEAELERRGGEWFLQIAVDVVHVLPVAAGLGWAIATHGNPIGADLAVAGAGAASSVLAERLSRLLGSEVARRARVDWRRLRGGRLSKALVSAVLLRSGPLLTRRADDGTGLATRLRKKMEEIPWETAR